MSALIPFALQAIAICFDEAYFHFKRGLPKWERLGHPLDTFTVLLCMAFVIWVPFSSHTLFLYVLLLGFSTKDEFVYKAHCPASQQWLHAFLFTLHPITLAFAGFIWPVVQSVEVAPWIADWLDNPNALKRFLYGQLGMMALFMTHQIVFWNILWKGRYDQ